MKLRLICILVAFSLVLTFCGCGEGREDAVSYPLDESLAEMSDELGDCSAAINGSVVKFPLYYSEFIKTGWELDSSLLHSKLGSGQYSIYKIKSGDEFSGAYFANFSEEEKEITECTVCGISSTVEQKVRVELPQKVLMGVSTLEEIKVAYGESEISSEDIESDTATGVLTYGSNESSALKLTLTDGILTGVELYNISNPDYSNASDKVPDEVKNYKAPEDLSYKLSDFTFYLYGTTYTMPLPVSRLVESGWVKAAVSDKYVLPGETLEGAIKLTRSNRTLTFDVKNLADYPTTVENCFITSIESKSSVKLDFTLAGGCRVGSSQSNFEATFNRKDFSTVTEKKGKTTYVYENEDKGKLMVVCSEGYISKIKVEM